MRKTERKVPDGQLALPMADLTVPTWYTRWQDIFTDLCNMPTRLDGLIGQRVHFTRAATELPNRTLELHAGRRSGRRNGMTIMERYEQIVERPGRSYFTTPPASIVPTEPAIYYLDTNGVRFVPACPRYWWIDEPASCARIDGIADSPKAQD